MTVHEPYYEDYKKYLKMSTDTIMTPNKIERDHFRRIAERSFTRIDWSKVPRLLREEYFGQDLSIKPQVKGETDDGLERV